MCMPSTHLFQLIDNEADVGIGFSVFSYLPNQFVDVTSSLYFAEGIWAYRYPIPKRDFIKVTKVFSWGIWIGMFSSIIAMALTFMLLHHVYSKTAPHLVRPVLNRADFLFRTFGSLFEPDEIPWFPKWSAGDEYP